MRHILIPLSCALALSAPALWAEPKDDDPGGVLNPDEMTWQSMWIVPRKARPGWCSVRPGT